MPSCQDHLKTERRAAGGGIGLLIAGVLLLLLGAAGITYAATHYTPEATAAAIWGFPGAVLGVIFVVIGALRRRRRAAMDRDAEQSPLVASIRRSLPPEQAGLPVGQLFALVDQDIASGEAFGGVTVGREWVIMVNCALRTERIRGIALKKKQNRTSHVRMNTYVVAVTDGSVQAEAEFATREHASECLAALQKICPAAQAAAADE